VRSLHGLHEDAAATYERLVVADDGVSRYQLRKLLEEFLRKRIWAGVAGCVVDKLERGSDIAFPQITHPPTIGDLAGSRARPAKYVI
jgi:hypothetical protein